MRIDPPRSGEPERGLRVLVFDRTCRGRPLLPGLSHSWAAGSRLYRGLGRLDAAFGATGWAEALAWLGSVAPGRRIAEVQFWGHGKWGGALVGGERLDASALVARHELWPLLEAMRSRFVLDGRGLWWWRTCETYGAVAGQRFASAWSDFLGARTAGHTHVIGFWQSGLHSLDAGARPGWDPGEGLARGSSSAPELALGSGPGRPHTITCLHGRIPEGY
ncbi:MAG: hypothetical protein IT371_08915 [Deltaproteobacteria bacterium]|nr:hypothetical protein [Deltaproteobacteria bacterium]